MKSSNFSFASRCLIALLVFCFQSAFAAALPPEIEHLFATVKQGDTRGMFQADFVQNITCAKQTADKPKVLWPKATNEVFEAFKTSYEQVERGGTESWQFLTAILACPAKIEFLEQKSEKVDQAETLAWFGKSVPFKDTYWISFEFDQQETSPVHSARLLKKAMIQVVLIDTPKKLLSAAYLEDGNEPWLDMVKPKILAVAFDTPFWSERTITIKTIGGPLTSIGLEVNGVPLVQPKDMSLNVEEIKESKATQMRHVTMRVKAESLPQGPLPFTVTVFASNAVADQASFVVAEPSRNSTHQYFIRSPWFEMKQWEGHQAGFSAWPRKVDRLRDVTTTNVQITLVSSSPSKTPESVTRAAQKSWSAITNSLPDGHLFPDRVLMYKLSLGAARNALDKNFSGTSGKYSIEKETKIGENVLHLQLASKPSMFGFDKKCQMLLSEETEGVLSLRLKMQIYGDSPQGGNRIPIHQSYYHTDSPSYARQAQQRVYEEMLDLLKKSLGQSIP